MKKNILNLTAFLVPAFVILSGCSDSNLGMLKTLSSQNITADAGSHGSLGYLSSDEESLAKNSTYTIIESKQDLSKTSFNFYNWPISCDANSSEKICGKELEGKLQGLRNIRITGLVVVIDTKDVFWAGLDGQPNIRSVTIEAEKVVIRNALHLPSANIVIRSQEIHVEKDGLIDVTPRTVSIKARFGFDPSGKPYTANSDGKTNISYNGRSGLKGGVIEIQAPKVSVYGDDQSHRFVAKGGIGEAAGAGYGPTESEFSDAMKSLTPMTTIDNEDTKKFPQYAGSIIYSAPHNRKIRNTDCFRKSAYKGKLEPKFKFSMTTYADCPRANQKIGPLGNANGWPADGVDAIAGGYPGAGGEGGVVVIETASDLPSDVADVSVGLNGKSDFNRKGSLPQKPFPAYKIGWKHEEENSDSSYIVGEDKPRKQGADAIAPVAPVPSLVNVPGKIILNSLDKGPQYSEKYFSLRMKRTKTLYVARLFSSTIAFLKETRRQYDQRVSGEQNLSAEMMDFDSQIKKMSLSILNQKDYFGRGITDVPLYTFIFNSEMFEKELNRTLHNYYLYKYFERTGADSEKRKQALIDILSQTKDKIATSTAQLNTTSELIGSLAYQKEQINLNQKSIQVMLDDINKQIEEKARQEVEFRKGALRLKKLVSVAAAICKVIPVYQPMLAAGATLVEGVVNGPKTNTAEGWIDFVADVKNNYDNVSSDKTLAESKKNFDDLKNRFDLSSLDGKSEKESVEYVSDLYGKYRPVVDKVINASAPLNQPRYGDDDIRAQIKHIQTSDPVFKPLFEDLSRKVSLLMDQKLKLQSDVMTLSRVSEQLMVDLRSYIVVSVAASDSAVTTYWGEDGYLALLFSSAADDSRDKLYGIYSQIIASYEYVTLKPFDATGKKMSIIEINDKLEESLNKASESEAVELLQNFFMSRVEDVKSALRNEIYGNSRTVRTIATKKPWYLTPEQVGGLNRNGYVDIYLDANFYQDKENVRIKDISVDDYAFNKNGWSVDQDHTVSLKVELDSKGDVIYNDKTVSFVYPKDERGSDIFFWSHEFQFHGQSVRSQRGINMKFAGLLDFDISKQDKEALFTSHAGITRMRVRMKRTQGAPVIEQLTLNIDYFYSE